ncbi:hypothetical protein ACIBEJ_02360 [Nonomuraea sp. NPDC050790]|uniref:hypothetical protein n=1 Tax=Nonomuraea sp. NPDC050790 TaxID=3364371 RepID=UPI00378B7914
MTQMPPSADRFDFAFDDRYRWPLWLLGIRPGNCAVMVTERGVRARFGPWELVTDLPNLAGAELSGPYAAIKAIGPRISLADRGLTFGTNTRQGVCLRFHHPVNGGEPIGLMRHPGLTVTVADPAALIRRLQPYLERG